jgi:hypothetical protein
MKLEYKDGFLYRVDDAGHSEPVLNADQLGGVCHVAVSVIPTMSKKDLSKLRANFEKCVKAAQPSPNQLALIDALCSLSMDELMELDFSALCPISTKI